MNARIRLLLLAALVLVGLVLTARSVDAYSNGRLPDSAVSPINTGASCNQLRHDAAAGFNSMSLAERRRLTINGCASAYRTYAQQVQLRNYWCSRGACGNAAQPGTSNHGWGLAVDVSQSTRATIDRIGRAFGFCKCWSDASWEWWHVLYQTGHFSRPDPGLNLISPTLRRGSGGPGQAPYVRQLQHLLRRAGARQLSVDGDFGRRTSQAVRIYQRAHNLKPDGVVGPNTWQRLRGPVNRGHQHRRTLDYLKTTGPISGVDVSEHQGSINWDDVRKDGIEFAIVKATEGEDYTDRYFSRARLEAIAKQGIVAGAYHFLRPRPGRPGSREATFFGQTLRAAGYGVGDLRPVLDVEVTELGPVDTCEYVRSAAQRLRAIFGAKPIIYTAPYFASVNLDVCGQWIGHLPLWIAHVGVSSPIVPAPWPGYVIWQHSWTAQVDGISGGVDHNLLPGGKDVLRDLTLRASGNGHGGDDGDGNHDPPDGGHRRRPPCSSKAHPYRCHLHRRCERGGHPKACRREKRLIERIRERNDRPAARWAE